jgi:hypothetical protein
VTNCAASPVTVAGGWTQINLPTSDVIIRCALTQLPGSTGVKITAHSILADGPGGGSIASTGSNGIQLTAGSGASCDAGATVGLESTTVTDGNINGALKVTACGDLVVNASTVSSAGNTVTVTSSKGRVCATGDSFSGRAVSVTASLDLTMHGSTVTLSDPSDTIKLASNNGSVLAGGGVCPPNRFQGAGASNLTVTAKQVVDLSNACVDIGQNITITASGTGFACATDTIINLTGSEIRNDFGKSGTITATACGGTGRITIGNAILLDNGNGDPNRVSKLNNSLATQAVNCAATTTPTCSTRPLDAANNPVSASPADRAAHNVVGVPRCDS